jgi:hypothetical protein
MSASQATTAAGSSKRNKKGKEKARCSRHPPPRKRLHCEKGPVSMVDYESETISRSRESLTFSYSIECDRQETFVHPSSTAGVLAGGRACERRINETPAGRLDNFIYCTWMHFFFIFDNGIWHKSSSISAVLIEFKVTQKSSQGASHFCPVANAQLPDYFCNLSVCCPRFQFRPLLSQPPSFPLSC